jgi:catechol 2,3-dioxygenase-like lactoylglutathione lyase family enzyme
MGVDGASKFAQGPDKDPSRPHVALAVADIQEAKAELERMGVAFWVTTGVVGPQSQQIFMYDPFGNMIELHQADTCRCVIGNRKPVAGMS